MRLTEIQGLMRTEENRARIRELTTPQFVAWPTVAMMMVSLTVYGFSVALSLLGTLPLWAGGLINGLIGYLIFSVIHDSIHRAVSSNQRLNDFLGQLSLVAFSPMVTLGAFRWGHIQHHQHASGEKDPDRFAFEGPKWLLPLRWMFIDVWYFYFMIRSGDRVAARHLKPTLVATTLTLSAFAAATVMGFGWEIFWLWFVPTRITQLLLGYAFFWLPHEPHDTPQEENFTRATCMRLGQEWLMTPLLQYHNYHLVHHLFPRTPFYRHGEMWRLLKPQLEQHELAIQHDFSVKPRIYGQGDMPGRPG